MLDYYPQKEEVQKVTVNPVRINKLLGVNVPMDQFINILESLEFKCNLVSSEVLELEVPTFRLDITEDADILEEYYYNLESATVTKVSPSGKTYKVGDVINVSGETYSYPDNFDVIVLRDKVAVTVRDKKIEAITKLEEYTYTGTPVVNSRGFEIRLNGEDDYNNLINDLNAIETANKPLNDEFFNKWTKFDTYRKIIFMDEVC